MLKHASRNHHDCNHVSVCGSAALSTLPLAGSPCRVWLQKTFITPEVPPPAPGPRSAHMGLPASDTWCQWTQAACGFCVWLRALSGWGQSSSTLGQQRLCPYGRVLPPSVCEPQLVSHMSVEGHLCSCMRGDGFGPPEHDLALPRPAGPRVRASRPLEVAGAAVHLKRRGDPRPVSRGFPEAAVLYPGEVQESHTEGAVAARLFLPTLPSEAGPGVLGELSLSVTA